jgi:hypothetical protein
MSGDAPTTIDTSVYRLRREQDWAAFVAGSGPPADHWALWEETSFGWRPEIAFFQPVGTDYPALVERIEPLRSALGAIGGVELLPAGFLHLNYLRLGFLRAVDIYWSQVETFYVNAAPRLHRVAPFDVHVGGVSAREDLVYLGVDDGMVFREMRRHIALGVPKAGQVLKEAGIKPGIEDDPFIPEIPIAFFAGGGDRSAIVEALSPFLDADFGNYRVTHAKLGRAAPDPDVHFPDLDVVAEMVLYGPDHRKGYHN